MYIMYLHKGEALAHVFYIAGCKVVLAARRKDELERVRKDLLQIHSLSTTHPPVIIQMDLTDINSLPDKVKQVLDIYSCIDILVNNGTFETCV
jgi:dehydrogenase/reductase SDR family member 7B